MDSVTQAALGAAIGVAVMHRHRPVWQSALAGALIGTLPDLDVFIDKGDAVRDMVLHRAETHAFFWQLLVSPLLAGVLAWLTRTRELYGRWWLLVILGLVTHSMLDAMTVYGTQVWLPFSNRPVGLGSLFIIDPLYTLPLVVGVVGTLVWRRGARWRWNLAGLLLSTLYAGWSVAAQAYVTERVRAAPEAAQLDERRILVTPTPFNTLLWRIVLVTEDHYYESFRSLLDPPGAIAFERYERGAVLDRRTAGFGDADLIRRFSRGFYALSDDGHRIRITDLRMGQEPYYPFSFAFAEHHSEPLVPIEPIRHRSRLPIGPGMHWLWQRIRGLPVVTPREQA